MQRVLYPLAFVSKIFAVIISLFVGAQMLLANVMNLHVFTLYVIFRLACELVLVLVALVPNRWLVGSPAAFRISLAVSVLLPLAGLIHDSWPNTLALLILNPSALLFVAVIYGLLPLSLILSFWRSQKGEEVTYA